MLIRTERVDNTLLIRVDEARLMGNKAAELRTGVARVVGLGENHHLVMDLSGVEFLDSSGLGCLIAIKKMVGKEGSLALCGLSESVRNSFRLTRMDAVFDIFDNPELALAA